MILPEQCMSATPPKFPWVSMIKVKPVDLRGQVGFNWFTPVPCCRSCQVLRLFRCIILSGFEHKSTTSFTDFHLSTSRN